MAVSPMSVAFPAPTGVQARFTGGAGGATTRYYWVQAIYPGGFSPLGQSNLVTVPSSMDKNNVGLITWNPMAGAIGYNVYTSTSAVAPTQGSILMGTVTGSNFTDQGSSNASNLQTAYVAGSGQFNVARGQYNFTTDGGAISTITIALSDLIPAGAILLGGTANPTTALTSGGSATIGIGVTAGLASPTVALKAATAVASYSLDALLPLIPVFATPLKMTASGTLTITIATATVTAGVMEIFLYYIVPINL